MDDHEAWLFDDLAAFTRQLAGWLPADNTVLPTIAGADNLRHNS